MKSCLSIFVAISFVIMGIATIFWDKPMSTFIAVLVVIAVIVIIISFIYYYQQTSAEMGWKQTKVNLEHFFEEEYASFKSQNGIPDKEIIVKPSKMDGLILVYNAKQRIYILGTFYKFKDIIGVQLIDQAKGVIININKVESPIIRISTPMNSDLAYEILGTINVIISKNKQNPNSKNISSNVVDLTDFSDHK